jgi:hypothetical protein
MLILSQLHAMFVFFVSVKSGSCSEVCQHTKFRGLTLNGDNFAPISQV